jgi:hypothetical protein
MPIISGGSGGSGASRILFSSILGADAASIDTGAGGIVTSFSVLIIDIIARNDDAAASSALTLTLNNDATAIYDRVHVRDVNATVTGAPTAASNGWLLSCHGAGGAASTAATMSIRIPLYGATTFFKSGQLWMGQAEATAANNEIWIDSLTYRSTTAISRAKITTGGASTVLKAGSAMIISAI